MFKNWLAPATLSALIVVSACSSHKKDKIETPETASATYTMPVSQEGLDKVTETWPQSSKSAIQSLNGKYGLPSAVTDDMVVWNNTAPFKRTIVYKEEINHKFPMEHSDILLQTVDYKVPKDKVAQLAKFDGSIIVDRVRGELSARNEREEMNILALNLSDKIVRGEMTPEQARREFSKNAEAFAAGTSGEMLTGLSFQPTGNTADPDSTMQSQESKGQMTRKKFESETVEEVIDEQN
jgi:hypothetical protein